MKKANNLRYLPVLFILFFAMQSYGQNINLQVHGRNHYNVNSYNGISVNDGIREYIQLDLQSQNIDLKNWSIRFKINAPILPNVPNIAKTPFPIEKLRIKPTSSTFSGNVHEPRPRLENLQVNMAGIPFQPIGSEASFIENASIPIRNEHSGGQLKYEFAFEILPGRYLEGMLSDIGGVTWNQNPALYVVETTFTLYNGANQPIKSFNYQLKIQMHRPFGGTPPIEEPDYGLEVLGEARNGQVEFSKMNDYQTGVSVTYPNSVKVKSNTAYEVRVKSFNTELVDDMKGISIPADILNIELQKGSMNSGTSFGFPKIQLSVSPQVVIHSTSGNQTPQFFDLKYSVPNTDNRIHNITTGRYSTTLQYQLIPK